MTDLAMSGVTVRILHFSVQIWILLKTSPDTIQTIPFGRDHPTPISATIIDLAILRVTVRILCLRNSLLASASIRNIVVLIRICEMVPLQVQASVK